MSFASRRFRFGMFELNLHDRDLRKSGLRVKLQEQPLQILELLLETPGDVVTRDHLAKHLWPDLHVNFEHSLNTAVNALRQALGDSSRNPRFIETRPGLGYRFIAPVEPIGSHHGYWNAPKARPEAGSFEAHQNYLKGRYFHSKMTEADLHKSIAYFEAALAQDPFYALAYTGLADTYCLFAFMGVLPSREAHERATEYAMAALRIGRDLPETHAALATLKRLYEWDWACCEAGYRRALELNPDFASGHQRFASHLSASGRQDEGLQETGCPLVP